MRSKYEQAPAHEIGLGAGVALAAFCDAGSAPIERDAVSGYVAEFRLARTVGIHRINFVGSYQISIRIKSDLRTIRAEDRVRVVGGIVRQPRLGASIGIHRIDLVFSVPIGHEDDFLTVRAVTRAEIFAGSRSQR